MSLNQVTVIGNIGRIETKEVSPGKTVTNFSVAVSDRWKDKNGEQQEQTEWIKCTAWNKTAEVIGDRCVVGSQVGVIGSLRTRKYEKDGVEKYATEVMVQRAISLPQKSVSLENAPKGETPDFEGGFDANEEIPF